MNIGILTMTDPVLRKLLANGLADAKTPQVESGAADRAEVARPAVRRPAGNIAPSTRFASMRAALDARIAADISSGSLAENDAVAVRKTLDDIDNRSDPTAAIGQEQAKFGVYSAAGSPHQAARAYLATIEPGTLVDRIG